ncbi:restriction endonuclease subunit S [Neorhizobium vignae]|uniref:restriction endonuclease subunit S n=1 Tax=Neorhizobium vignae TaxID=690585 RepID=UPI00055F5B3B|nr:restriction endonuclease subunit S [Neorhizobium vignae]
MLERPGFPAGWTRVRFDEIATQINDRVDNPAEAGVERYVGLEHVDPDSLRIRRWGEPTDVESTKLRFQPGDIIFGKRRVYQRKVAVADFEGICSAHAMVLRAKPGVMLPDLLPFFMQSDLFMERALSISVGSLSPTINWKALAAEEFLLPPVQEQARLMEAFTASHSAIEALLDARAKLDQLETASLLAKFGEKYGSNPEGYELRPLALIAEIRTGLAKGKPSGAATINLPYLSVANVKDGFLDLSEVKEITVEHNRVQRYSLQSGDVLMTEGGDLDKLGRGTVWQAEIPLCLHQNHVFAVRTDIGILDPWFLAAIARSVYGKSYFRKCAKRSSNLASINKAQVSAFLVPAVPVIEQRNWLQAYQEIRRQGDRLSKRIAELRAVMKRIVEAEFADVV